MVTNVIARLSGTASTGAIVLSAHYDSGATGPAAGDNGAAVAATLEIVRAIQAGPPLANDLIVVFSDAEEIGDLGAAAFNQDHPWADEVRLAINFEAQGSSGPAILYATSNDNEWLTEQYFQVAPEGSGYSLLPEIVRQLPGMRLACDLEDYLLNGSDGLGFVFASDTRRITPSGIASPTSIAAASSRRGRTRSRWCGTSAPATWPTCRAPRIGSFSISCPE
jgi:Zn-dependent M28 family amino/carboxypeptidase